MTQFEVAALLISLGFIRRSTYHALVLSILLFIVVVIAPATGSLTITL